MIIKAQICDGKRQTVFHVKYLKNLGTYMNRMKKFYTTSAGFVNNGQGLSDYNRLKAQHDPH